MNEPVPTFEQIPSLLNGLISELKHLRSEIQVLKNEIKPEPVYRNHSQAATFLGIAEQTLYGVNSRGEMTYIQRNGKNMYKTSDLVAYLEKGKKLSKDEIAKNPENNLKKNRK